MRPLLAMMYKPQVTLSDQLVQKTFLPVRGVLRDGA